MPQKPSSNAGYPFVHRPVWGLGPTGWVLLPIALALVVSMAAGVDLRHQLFRLIEGTMGVKALFTFVTTWLTAAGIHYTMPGFGMLALIPVLVACHFCPRPVPWWKYTLVVLWSIACPLVWLQSNNMFKGGIWLPVDAEFIAQCAYETLITGGLVLLITSRLRYAALSIGGMFAAMFAYKIAGTFCTVTNVDSMKWVLWFIAALYHLGLVSGLVWWAHEGRVKCRLWAHSCDGCGYTLRGLNPGSDGKITCPECGRVRSRESAARARNPVA